MIDIAFESILSFRNLVMSPVDHRCYAFYNGALPPIDPESPSFTFVVVVPAINSPTSLPLKPDPFLARIQGRLYPYGYMNDEFDGTIFPDVAYAIEQPSTNFFNHLLVEGVVAGWDETEETIDIEIEPGYHVR